MDIDELTDEQIDELVSSEELKCKIDAKSGEMRCATSEDLDRALARLKNPVKRVIFEVTSEPAKVTQS